MTQARRVAWWPSLAAAGVGLAVLAALFLPEMRAAVGVWSASTAFGHCYLVLPIAAWLVWERRALLVPLTPQPWPVAALLIVPCMLAWLAAERLGLMEGRQLAALGMVWVLALVAFGWRVTKVLAPPLGYLVFLVPFGAFLVPALQDITAQFVDVGLGLLGIPHYVDQTLIDIPEGSFLVAEACAGLRFLIAAIAFGTMYALLIYRSAWRRLLFIAASIGIPIVANGMRALGIVLLGHALGSAQAGAVDHVLYGWLFFSLVILALILVGLPFREDRGPYRVSPVPPSAPAPLRASWVAVACVLGLSCLGPALAFALDRAPGQTGALATITVPPRCQAAPAGGAEQRYACAQGVTLQVRWFGPRAGAGRVQAALQAGEHVLQGEEIDHAGLAVGAGTWRLASSDSPEGAVASALWLGGRASAGGLRDRFTLAWASLSGSGAAVAVATLTAAGPGAERAVRALAAEIRLSPDAAPAAD